MRAISAMVIGTLLLAASPAPVHGNDFDTEMSIQRDELRNQYRKLGRELREVEGAITQEQNTLTTVSGPSSAVWAVRDNMREHMRRLGSRRGELRSRRVEIEREFRRLTAKVEAHYGTVPVWWGDLD
jgi:chromosome segregation ATPase